MHFEISENFDIDYNREDWGKEGRIIDVIDGDENEVRDCELNENSVINNENWSMKKVLYCRRYGLTIHKSFKTGSTPVILLQVVVGKIIKLTEVAPVLTLFLLSQKQLLQWN